MSEPGLAEWIEADEEIRRLETLIEGLSVIIEGGDRELAAKAKKRRGELQAALTQKKASLVQRSAEITRRGLERAVLDEQYPHWRKLLLASRANDTPDFEHFTRLFAEALEQDFQDRVLLWFASFPITGKLAAAASGHSSPLLLVTTLYLRARSEQDFTEVLSWINSKEHPRQPWFEDWRKVATRNFSDGEVSFEQGAFKNQDAPEFEEWERVEPEESPEPQADDLYIAAEDGRMYLMRSGDYRPSRGTCTPSWREVQAKETTATKRTAEVVSSSLGNIDREAETQLARRMIDAGVSLAAIPSTGLPTRGTYCFLVNLAEYPAKSAASRK